MNKSDSLRIIQHFTFQEKFLIASYTGLKPLDPAAPRAFMAAALKRSLNPAVRTTPRCEVLIESCLRKLFSQASLSGRGSV